MQSLIFTLLAIFQFACLSFFASVDAVPVPASPKTDGKKPNTFLASNPHWVVYTDEWINGQNGPPAASSLAGFNTYILGFLLTSGPADQAQAWADLDSGTRNNVIQDYHNHGISLMVSAFGSTDSPTSDGADPVATAHTIASWVKQYGLDGVDVDYEDFNAMNSGTGSAENWLVSFTNTLRGDLPAGQYLITHAPVAPWFTDDTNLYPHGGYKAVNSRAGSKIDWYNVQFYNQGSDYYDCNSIFQQSQSDFPHTSVFEMNNNGVSLNKIVMGKPGSAGDAESGYIGPNHLAACISQAKSQGWSGGAMFWEFPEANSAFIKKVRAQSWPV